jgi:uncharacterized repeat protein (TIGR01451 family)
MLTWTTFQWCNAPRACFPGSFTLLVLILLAGGSLQAWADPQLSLPATVVEGTGTMTNAGKLTLGGITASNVSFALSFSDPSSVAGPATVTVLAGQSNALFNLLVGDNLVADGDRSVTVTANADSFPQATNTVRVLDNDADHIRFAAVPSLVDTNTAVGLQMYAEKADGSMQTNFNLGLNMVAEGLEGLLPLDPTNTGNFVKGQKYVGIRVTAPGRAVRFRSLEYPGQSDAFTVIPPAFFAISQPVADIVWIAGSQVLLASVPASGGVYSNSLVAIDPATGLVTNSYPVGVNPSQIEISPAGTYLYVALDSRKSLQRFDLNTMSAGASFALSASTDPFRFAYDFCVPPGLADSVVVEARDQNSLGSVSRAGIFRYSSGVPTLLANFYASGGWCLESLDSSLGVAVSPPLARGNASTGTLLASSTDFAGTTVAFRAGQLYDDRGNFYSASSLARLGSYPNVLEQSYYTAIPEVDPAQRRVFYLAGYFNYGTSMYKLKVYDLDLCQPLCQMTVPGTTGSPGRFLRCGTNALAYVTGNGQLWFIRPDATQPSSPAADLALSLSALPPIAIAGSNYTFSVCLSNAGPGVATVIRVTNALPANASVVWSLPSTGTVALATSAFTWNVPELPAGSNATLQLTLRFNNAGWQTNATWALGFETDPVFTNNLVTLPLYVQLPPDALGVFALNFSSEDLLYDPVRDRLLVSVGSGGPPGQKNGLALINPYSGLAESFVALGKKPARLARSDDGQFLYVSLKEDTRVRRLVLSTMASNLDFTLGSESWYDVQQPYYAANMAVVPGQPQSLAVWRVRAVTGISSEYGRGIAVFDDGVMRPNVTDSGGSWAVEFDTQSGTLFGYASGDLRRCAVDSNGVSFVEQFPMFYGAGNDIEYAAGQLFTSAGRLVQYQPFRVAWVFAGAEGAALVEPDAASGRVFYLVQNNGWQLKVYDTERRLLVGSIPVPNVAGTPTSLVRWGTNGLAFRTSSDQLFIVRTPLVQPSTEVDLAVAIQGPDTPVDAGKDALLILTLTNRGPFSAANVVLTNTFSPAVSINWSFCTDGSIVVSNGQVVWSLPEARAGLDSFAAVVIRASQTGAVSVAASVTSATPEAQPGDNSAFLVLPVGGGLGSDGMMMLQLAANGLAWSPALGKLLLTSTASTPNWSGGLLSLDPTTLAVRCECLLGANAGRLSASRDDRMLYAGVDYGVSALTLPDLVVANRFLINPSDPRGVAADIKAVPGSSQSVAVASTTWLGTYDGVELRTNTDSFSSPTVSLEFGDDPSVLYRGGSGFRRYTLNAQGFTLLDSDTTLLPASTAVDLVWGSNRIYTSLGKVINPFTRTLVGTIAGIPTGSRVLYDSGCGRVFYLCPGTNQAVLKAFDGPSLLPAGSRIIPGVSGSLGGFVRWGLDAFAASTSSGQMVLFRSGLVATNPPADVVVSLSHSTPPYLAGSNITATIGITNAGPNAATDVAWNNVLPIGTIIVSALPSAGSATILSNTVSGYIPLLTNSAAATVIVTFHAPAAGIMTNQVSATASSIDPAFTNNFATALLWVQPPTGVPDTISLTLSLKDLERDPLRPLLYASFGSGAGALADSVVALDPINGNIGAPIHVGSNPGRMTASPDGQFLYVALDGAGTVQKLTLPDLALAGSFAVPQNQTVARMAVSPANPEMVVIRRTPGARTSLHVGGVQQPGELVDQDLFAFSQASGQLYGCDGYHSNVKLYRLNTTPSGLSLLESQPGKQSGAADLKPSGSLLFFDRGMVLNPDTARVRAQMPVSATSVVEPDAASGRAYYLTLSGSAWTLRAFDIAQAIEVGAVAMPALTSAPRRLLRWGPDGLAFYNTNSQVVILRGQLVPTNPPVDLVLSQSFSTPTATTNDTLSISLQLTNLGPGTASSVIVTQSYSLLLTNVSFAASTGTASFTNGMTTWQVDSMPTGAVASLTVTLQALQPGTLSASASAWHPLNDAFWGNNCALSAVSIWNPAASNILQLPLSTRDLVYDSARNVIYASTPASNRLAGNLVAVVNPATGQLKQALAAGSEPNQLALSDDAKYLHVAVNGAVGVQRFDLTSDTLDLSFQFATNDIYYAQDLKAQPGHPETVAASLGSYNWASGYPSDVIIYDSGLPRPTRGGPARNLSFGANGGCLFGNVSPGVGYGLERMWPTPDGFQTDEVGVFNSIPGELKFSNGRLYGASGEVVDPYAPAYIGSVSASGPQAIDVAKGRAFYLAQKGTSWELRAFDLATLQPTGTQTVANVKGTPGSLIRCGADRLAFRTSSNQVFIVQSPLVPASTLLAANLAVTQQAAQDFTAPLETLRYVIAVTNYGPGTASNVLLAIKPPTPVDSVTLQLPQGTSTNSGANYLCNLGSLPPNQSLAVVLSAVITNTASYTNFASVSSATPDPDLTDNSSQAALQGLWFQRPNSVQIYPVMTRSLAYDPVRQRLFAALPPVGGTNLIGWFDPQTGVAQGTLPVGILTDGMRVTDDGQYLYLFAGSTGLLQRVALSTLTLDLSFTPPQALRVSAMAIIPGNPHALALSYWTTNSGITSVFDDGVERPDQVIGNGYSLLTCSTDGTALYGLDQGSTGGASPDVFRMTISSTGLQPLDNGPSDTPWGANVAMQYGLDRLFFANGNVLNPVTWAEEQAFSLPYWGAGLDLIPSQSAAAFLSGDLSSYFLVHLGIYALNGRQQLAQFDIHTAGMYFSSLVWCGADRFAFRSSSELIFVRSSAVPAADITLHGSVSTNQIQLGDTVNHQLLVSNAGPYAVSGVLLTNHLPAGFSILSADVSQGTLSTNGSTIVASLGALATNATATLDVTLLATSAALGWTTNWAEAWASNQPDPIVFNNHLEQSLLTVLRDTDHDGIPDDWEIPHGLNPNNPSDALLDSDGDGTSNLQEYLAGTDPFVFDGVRILSAQVTGNGAVDLTVHAAAGVTYALETSTNFVDWSLLRLFVCPGTNYTVHAAVDSILPLVFFRLHITTNLPVPILSLANVPMLGTDLPLLQIDAPPGHHYVLAVSSNLVDWAEVTNYHATIWTSRITDSAAAGCSQRFYRAMTR